MTSTSACPASLHNTRWAYDHHHCRCPGALAVNAEKAARRRAGLRSPITPADHHDVDVDKVDAVVHQNRPVPLGVVERRLATTRLSWMGRGAGDIARRLGVTERTVGRVLARQREAGLVL